MPAPWELGNATRKKFKKTPPIARKWLKSTQVEPEHIAWVHAWGESGGGGWCKTGHEK